MIGDVSVEDVLGRVTVVAFGLGVLWLAARSVAKARASKLQSQRANWLAAASAWTAFALPVFALAGPGPEAPLTDVAAQGFLVLVVAALALWLAAWVLRWVERRGADRGATELGLPAERRLAPAWIVATLSGFVGGVLLTVAASLLLLEVGVITDQSGPNWFMSVEIVCVTLAAVTGWWIQSARRRRYFHERGASRDLPLPMPWAPDAIANKHQRLNQTFFAPCPPGQEMRVIALTISGLVLGLLAWLLGLAFIWPQLEAAPGPVGATAVVLWTLAGVWLAPEAVFPGVGTALHRRRVEGDGQR